MYICVCLCELQKHKGMLNYYLGGAMCLSKLYERTYLKLHSLSDVMQIRKQTEVKIDRFFFYQLLAKKKENSIN